MKEEIRGLYRRKGDEKDWERSYNISSQCGYMGKL